MEVVEMLLEGGAGVNNVDFKCWTPLHCSCNAGHLNVCLSLLSAGADVNAVEVGACVSIIRFSPSVVVVAVIVLLLLSSSPSFFFSLFFLFFILPPYIWFSLLDTTSLSSKEEARRL
jgi:hypothetical protein